MWKLFVPLTDLISSCCGDFQGKSRRSAQSHPQAPIYEEMTGVKTANRKLAPPHLEETECSEYRNCPTKKSCPENHYESPSGALFPRRVSLKWGSRRPHRHHELHQLIMSAAWNLLDSNYHFSSTDVNTLYIPHTVSFYFMYIRLLIIC